MELSKDKDKLKKERAESKALRSKIVGVGNTIDSYGDKFLSGNTDKNDRNYYENRKFENNSYQRANKDTEGGFGSMGTYDQYQSSKTLSERIGNIIEGVNKYEEQKKEAEKKEGKTKGEKNTKATKGTKSEKNEKAEKDNLADLDLLDFGDERPVVKSTVNKPDEINLLDM